MNIKDRVTKLGGVVEYMKKSPDSPVIIQTQMDLDSIGSSGGTAFVLEKQYGIRSRNVYFGSVGHRQNRSLFNRYNLGAIMHQASWNNITQESPIILVDSSSLDDSRMGGPSWLLKPSIVIDHHRDSQVKEDKKSFIWIEDVGAASTLVTELIRGLGLKFGDDEVTPLLLALGIYADTYSLTGAGRRDFQGFNWLRKFYSQDDFREALRYSLSPYYFENVKHALNHMVIQGPRLVANAGIINTDEGDDLATISDELIRIEGITLAVVWGLIQNPDDEQYTIRLSARSQDPSISLGAFLRSRFDAGGAKVTGDGKGIGGATFPVQSTWNEGRLEGEKLLKVAEVMMRELVFEE